MEGEHGAWGMGQAGTAARRRHLMSEKAGKIGGAVSSQDHQDSISRGIISKLLPNGVSSMPQRSLPGIGYQLMGLL